MEKNNKKQRIYLIVGIVLFLILVLSASYAYFQITSVNNATTTTVTGAGQELGNPTLTTNTTSLKLNLTVDFMQNRIRDRIYATTSGEGVVESGYCPSCSPASTVALGNGRYKLATASVTTSDLSYNCDYSFDVSATVNKTINDESGDDIHILITTPKGEILTYNLSELLAGTKTISGVITNLTVGTAQEFLIESFVYNNGINEQNDLSGITYTINVTPKSGTTGFKCDVASTSKMKGFAKNLIDSNQMIQTGLEGDGYRFVGTGDKDYCIYDNNQYYLEKTGDTCPTLYNYTETATDNAGEVYNYKYEDVCPESDSSFNISCSSLTGTTEKLVPKNFVCFGTTDKSACTSNPDKYMYRIIGVFSDEYGNQHVKLVKKNTLGTYAWHSTNDNQINWQDSDLYKGLNGSYFYSNTTYDYMQNTTWRNKIANWKWTASMPYNLHRMNANDILRVAPMNYSTEYNASTSIQKETYLHEMNRKNKKYIRGNWKYNTAKIGMMYISDYYLSVPIIDEKFENFSNGIGNLYLSSWLNPANNFNDLNTMTMARIVNMYSSSNYYYIRSYKRGSVNTFSASTKAANEVTNVQPTFYLNSDVELESGTGTDPYILK